MTMLITGGAGFIGSNFIYYILQKHPDYRVVCLDKLTYAGNLSTLEKAMKNPNFRFVQADICEKTAVEKLFDEERPNYVINFAAESHVDRSINDPDLFFKTNFLGVGILLDACLKYCVLKFHQVSTDEVYGDLPIDKPDLSFTENASLKPSSPYSASKAAADLLVISYYKTYGLNVSISRSSNNFGPYQFPEKLIPLMIINALNDKPLPVYGDGKNVRDWIYVTDHCEAIDLIVHSDKSGEIYNIGANNEMSNINLVRLICKELNKTESLISYVEDRKGHDRRYSVDSSKLKKELGWEAKTDFLSSFKNTVDWYLNNREWWMNIGDNN